MLATVRFIEAHFWVMLSIIAVMISGSRQWRAGHEDKNRALIKILLTSAIIIIIGISADTLSKTADKLSNTADTFSSAEPPVKVEIMTFGDGSKSFQVVSISDEPITVKEIVINKGNCKAFQWPVHEGPVRFGEYINYPIPFSCHPIQVDVSVVNKGQWTFKFN